MTVDELVKYCKKKGIPLSTQIAMRAKDDYFLVEGCLSLDVPYFGNSAEGEEWLRNNAPKDAEGDTDFDNIPKFLILDTDYS